MTVSGGGTPASTGRACPYVGLEPYAEADAPFFFGRERERRIITANLRSTRLTLLYGASGVGKSSVLAAGVVHDLRERVRANVAAQNLPRGRGVEGAAPRAPFAIADFRRWRDPDPLARLVERIHGSVQEAIGGDVERWDGDAPVVATLRAWTKRVRTLLVVFDQFEEYFVYHPDEGGDGSFAGELPRLVNDPSLHVNVLISIREDAWAKLDRFKGRVPHLFSNYLRVRHLDSAAARRAIEGPVEEFNRRLQPGQAPFGIEPALVDAVLDDVRTGGLSLASRDEAVAPQQGRDSYGAGGRIETPFLQLVMTRLWEEAVAKGERELRRRTLDELGGAQRIVSNHLDESLDELDGDEQAVAAEAFRFLVTSARTKIAQSASDIAYWTKRADEQVTAVLDRLSHSEHGRVLRPLAAAAGEEGQRYELFHDILAEPVLEWRKRWEQEREKEELARQLAEEEQRKLEDERERHRERRNRLVRRAAAALLLLSVALAVMTVIALHQRGLARSRALAAASVAQLQTDPELSILLALEAWNRGQTGEAEEALRRAIGASRVRAVFRERRPLAGAVVSRDGGRVATATQDGSVRVYDLASRSRLAIGVPDVGELSTLLFSPDGRSLLVNGERATVVAPVGGRGPTIELDGSSGAFSTVFNRDGRLVAGGLDDGGAAIWDASTGRRRAALGHGEPFDSLAFSPTSSRLIATTSVEDGSARLWDWRTRRSRMLRRGPEDHSASGDDPEGFGIVRFSPDGAHVATTLADRRVHVWEVAAAAPVARLQAGRQTVSDFRWSDDGRRIVAVGDKTARVFVAATGRLVATLVGHADWVNRAGFSADGALVTTASDDGTGRIWEVASASTIDELRGHAGEVLTAAFGDGGRRIVTASRDGTARAWDAVDGRALRGHRDWVLSGAFSPDGRRVVTTSADGTARIWRLSDGMSVRVGGPSARRVNSVGFSRDGRRIAVGAETAEGSGRVVVADAATGRPRATWKTDVPAGATGFSPDGRHVVAAAKDVEIRSPTGKLERSLGLSFATQPVDADYSPDGTQIAVASFDGIARVFDVARRRVVATFAGHEGALTSVAFSPDGRLVVTAGADNTARVWRAAGGRPVAQLRGHLALVRSAAFSPDGRRVVTGSVDKTVRVWEARTGKLLSVQRQHADSVNDVAYAPRGRRILSVSDDHTAKIYGCATCASVERLLALAQRRVTRELTLDERRKFLGED